MGYKISCLTGDEGNKAIQKFWNSNPHGKLDQKLLWYYENNPTGLPLVFLAHEDTNDECIGCVTLFPRKFLINGQVINAGLAGDFFVRQDHRVLLPALKLQKALVACVDENRFDFIYGFPNLNAEGVLKRAGFKRLGPYFRLSRALRSYKWLKSRRYVGRMAAIVSPITDALLRFFALETWYRINGRFAFAEQRHIDYRFDRFWNEVGPRHPISGVRTSEFLAWKFMNAPGDSFRVFTSLELNTGELVGYVIYKVDEDSISIADLALPDSRKSAQIFLAHFMRHVKSADPTSVMLQFLQNEDIHTILKKFGFKIRSNDRSVFYYAHKDLLLRFPQLMDAENWLLTNFDLDS